MREVHSITERAIDSLRLHPDSERVPMAAADDLANLRTSLLEQGQQDPIHVAGDVILDGRTRWTLLRELGAATVLVNQVNIPDLQQTTYIVKRALSRRHLTAGQKRVLNSLLRTAVVEVRTDPTTGEEMRIGHGQKMRAETLGVERSTVARWDSEAIDRVANATRPPTPTHQVVPDGRVMPLSYPDRRSPTRAVTTRPPALRKSRPIPSWSRLITKWLRSARPEDRDYLRRLDREIHAALAANGLTCQAKGDE